ncbi:MAG: T9SS type A sorting domain-containing protein [Chitinophagaceae bacterium]
MRKLIFAVFAIFLINSHPVSAQGVKIIGGTYQAFEINYGSLWAWGYNDYGVLGIGNTDSKRSPVRVGTSTDWLDVFPGDVHTVALKTNGSLWTWGYNNLGQLGIGYTSFTTQKTPRQLGTDLDWQTAAAGIQHTLAIKNDGTLWSWGLNNHGQLGYNTFDSSNNKDTNAYVPRQVGTDNNWKSITAGYYYSLGLKTDGTLWAWGENKYGQLGIGLVTTESQINPVQVGTDNNWMQISAGYNTVEAIKTNGTLWGWGDNMKGQLGTGKIYPPNAEMRDSLPQQVGTATDWLAVSTSKEHTIALKTNNTLWGWGSNESGQLGNGEFWVAQRQLTPMQIGTDLWSTNFNAAGTSTYARKLDNTVWSWGENPYGKLGIGNETRQNTPQQILLPQNAVLPVTLLAFTVSSNDHENILMWSSDKEMNSDHFDVERSFDGINFEKIGQVNAKGNSSSRSNYQFEDKQKINAKEFYRLKIIDKDNRYSLSPVVVINMIVSTNIIQLYPNPAVDVIRIHAGNIGYKGNLKINILDVAGRQVKAIQLPVAAGSFETSIDINNLKKGTYFIQILELNKVVTFIKQ